MLGRRGGARKNKRSFVKIKNVYSEYKIYGLNVERLINRLKRENVSIVDLKKEKSNQTSISVKISDEQKFFAIAKELCYNIKKVRNKGKLLFLFNLINGPSTVIGAVLFCVVLIFCNDLLLSYNFSGNGSAYKNEVERLLVESNVKPFSRFSEIDLSELSDKILEQSSRFSFVNCKKAGNKLNVQLILSENQTHVNPNGTKDFISTTDGVVEKVQVYRGTPIVKQGDRVKKGDLLVAGYMEIKEKRVEVNALAVITLLVENKTAFIFESEQTEEQIISLVKDIEEEQIYHAFVNKEKLNGKYYYRVNYSVKRVIYTE